MARKRTYIREKITTKSREKVCRGQVNLTHVTYVLSEDIWLSSNSKDPKTKDNYNLTPTKKKNDLLKVPQGFAPAIFKQLYLDGHACSNPKGGKG